MDQISIQTSSCHLPWTRLAFRPLAVIIYRFRVQSLYLEPNSLNPNGFWIHLSSCIERPAGPMVTHLMKNNYQRVWSGPVRGTPSRVLTGLRMKNMVMAPTRGTSPMRGSRMTRSFPCSWKASDVVGEWLSSDSKSPHNVTSVLKPFTWIPLTPALQKYFLISTLISTSPA